MRQIVYFSTAAEPQDRELIHDILISSRINNRRDAITGLLVAGGNRYLQVIEGPREPVRRLFAKIRADRRHLGIVELQNKTIFRRCFEGWSMAYRTEPKLGEFDRFPDVVRYLAEQVEDGTIRNHIRTFARSFTATSMEVRATAWPEQRRTA